ncbi:MAG TPA: hypothetical protein VER17_17955 [Tepidisphaeraceae bacterium]|nr:hypothetical protein [Tepidisphaeraceae bacterium]
MGPVAQPSFALIVLIAVFVVALLLVLPSRGRGDPRRTCRQCGAAHPVFARFCRRCGRRL